jgi:Tol biopolymer transport system component
MEVGDGFAVHQHHNRDRPDLLADADRLMAGIRIGGVAFLDVISPPFSDFEIADGDTNVWRRSRSEAAGQATSYTDWDDAGSTLSEIFNPVLSPDETMIAYVGRLAGNMALYVCDNVPDSPSTLLDSDGSVNLNTPMWSPDSSTIVYTRGDGVVTYGGTVESIPATGGSPTVLYNPPANYSAFRPAYSFDGDFIAFGIVHTGADDGLWVMEDDGTNPVEIDGTFKYQFQGSQFGWANAERTLAFYDNAGGTNGDAWTIAHDGTGKTQITTGATSASQISCSKTCWVPDDSEVIIASNQGVGGFMSVYTCDPGGGGETLLYNGGPSTSSYWRTTFIYNNRIWFIKDISSANTGTIWSSNLDGTGLVEELDVNAGTPIIDWFSSGTGFEFQ